MAINQAQLQRFRNKIRLFMKEPEQIVKRFVFSFAESVWDDIITNSADAGFQYGSPVLTGRFIASHRVSLNGVDTSVAPEAPENAASPFYSAPSRNTVFQELSGWKLGDSVSISNNLPYAGLLEGGDWSAKSPNGVYNIAFQSALLDVQREYLR